MPQTLKLHPDWQKFIDMLKPYNVPSEIVWRAYEHAMNAGVRRDGYRELYG